MAVNQREMHCSYTKVCIMRCACPSDTTKGQSYQQFTMICVHNTLKINYKEIWSKTKIL